MPLDYKNLPLLLTVGDVAEMFRCSPATIRKKRNDNPNWLKPARHALMRKQLFATVDVLALLGHAAPVQVAVSVGKHEPLGPRRRSRRYGAGKARAHLGSRLNNGRRSTMQIVRLGWHGLRAIRRPHGPIMCCEATQRREWRSAPRARRFGSGFTSNHASARRAGRDASRFRRAGRSGSDWKRMLKEIGCGPTLMR